jgi:hypothetical protein
MVLTALQPQPEPKATPRSTKWCEIGQHGPRQTVVPLHKRMRYITALNHISEQNSCRLCAWRPVLITTFGSGAGSKLTAQTVAFRRRRKPCG